jgi:hypothetical protein
VPKVDLVLEAGSGCGCGCGCGSLMSGRKKLPAAVERTSNAIQDGPRYSVLVGPPAEFRCWSAGVLE